MFGKLEIIPRKSYRLNENRRVFWRLGKKSAFSGENREVSGQMAENKREMDGSQPLKSRGSKANPSKWLYRRKRRSWEGGKIVRVLAFPSILWKPLDVVGLGDRTAEIGVRFEEEG